MTRRTDVWEEAIDQQLTTCRRHKKMITENKTSLDDHKKIDVRVLLQQVLLEAAWMSSPRRQRLPNMEATTKRSHRLNLDTEFHRVCRRPQQTTERSRYLFIQKGEHRRTEICLPPELIHFPDLSSSTPVYSVVIRHYLKHLQQTLRKELASHLSLECKQNGRLERAGPSLYSLL